MSEAASSGARGPAPEFPDAWRILLVSKDLKVLSQRGGETGSGKPLATDLAELLGACGFALEEVGELLVCLEDLTAAKELTLSFKSGSGSRVSAKCILNRPATLCLVIHAEGLGGSKTLLDQAWKWGANEAHKMNQAVRGLAPARAFWALVVDENENSAAFLQALLRKSGCRSKAVTSPGAALALASSREFDLLLVDLDVGGIGADSLSTILTQRNRQIWGRDLFVVTLSKSSVSPKESGKGRSSLCRPVDLKDLGRIVQEAREYRDEQVDAGEELDSLAIIELSAWTEDFDLLCRLARALVAQGLEFFANLEETADQLDPNQVRAEVRSLKNGCDIVQAQRLSLTCERALKELETPRSQEALQCIDVLVDEFDLFRAFAIRKGLLLDGGSERSA